MRRKDREITDINEIINIIDKCDVCRFALIDNGIPYIVPMNFGYSIEDNIITLFFHSANEGRKIDVLKANPNVCIEMDCGHKLIIGDTDCSCAMNYESFIGNGKAEFIKNIDEKIFALSQIMKKYTDKDTFNFEDKMLNIIVVFKVELNDYTGKRRNNKK